VFQLKSAHTIVMGAGGAARYVIVGVNGPLSMPGVLSGKQDPQFSLVKFRINILLIVADSSIFINGGCSWIKRRR
jgi:hypothetical protein